MEKLKLFFSGIGIVFSSIIAANEYHVSVNGNNSNNGSALKPYKTISEAVRHAFPGDTITVHTGIYRERVNPLRGGENDSKRILYRAAPGEIVEIKGSEVISGWKNVKGSVWKIVLPNKFFGNYNPYQDSIFGDWFDNRGRIHHTGEVFLNGKSLYEKENIDKVFSPIPDDNIKDKEGSVYTWYSESDTNNTTIWANFQKSDPNKELVEISLRNTCFYPEKPGINYITIRGFHFSQAATQWGAPTAEQVGMIATHWNKGWIPEVKFVEQDGNGYLHISVSQSYFDQQLEMITTDLLGKAKIPKAAFDNPDGTPLKTDTDFLGNKRLESSVLAGPFASLVKGKQIIMIW